MTNWSEINAPWRRSYALWLERGEVSAPYKAKGFIEDRQLGVVLDGRSVRIEVDDHDWSAAYAWARAALGE